MYTKMLEVKNCTLTVDVYPNDKADITLIGLHGGPVGRVIYQIFL